MENNNKILIITGGQVDEAFLKQLTDGENYSMIIAADKGLIYADKLKLPLNFIAGDFDSVPHDILDRYQNTAVPIKTFPAEKDMTDTDIAIELAMRYNPACIDIVGATGSRLDHVIANIHLLLQPMQRKVRACILDMNNKIYLKNDDFIIKKQEQYGKYVSLMPFAGKITGLSMIGFKYPLNNILLQPGSSLCISNEIKEVEGRIEFDDGILVVFETKD